MDEEIREVTLEELLDESFVITEEKLVSRITEKELEKYTKIRNDIGQFLFNKTKRRPMVLPVVIKV